MKKLLTFLSLMSGMALAQTYSPEFLKVHKTSISGNVVKLG